jgi:hypothetical protein
VANWASLRKALDEVETSRTFDWAELDTLVGGLPRSAYEHSAFWSGSRTAWSGFLATNVALGARVTFVRHEPVEASAPAAPVQTTSPGQAPTDLLLVTCVKEKLKRPAEARDLYVSSLFQKQRAYAEACRVPWFILSAEHGLVAPDEWLAPYERYLPHTPPTYRKTWGHWVVERLALLAGPLSAKVVEVHAASAYIDTLRTPLTDKGAVLVEPLRGLALGQRLAWYGAHRSDASTTAKSSFARRLRVEANAVSPAEFVARGGTAGGWTTWAPPSYRAGSKSQSSPVSYTPG